MCQGKLKLCMILLLYQHGRIKVRTTAEQAEAKRKEREKKLKVYKETTSCIYEKVYPANAVSADLEFCKLLKPTATNQY